MPDDKNERKQFDGSEIAVIGMACRFPGANSLDEYWENLREGRESVSFFSEEELLTSGVDPALLGKPEYVKARPILNDIEVFDSAFFGFSPLEAKFMDPQHRLFLEIVWQAIESAGYNPDSYEGAISVIAGESMNSYLHNNIYANPEAVAVAGSFQGALFNNVSSLTTLIAYKFNLKGACYSVQSFCSTSLVAVHIACQNLLNYECDMAIAGGVSIVVPQKTGYLYEEGSILSQDGHCRPFSDDAGGTLFGNGSGAVVLKRLKDALADGDAIDALIIGSALNNDGSLKASYAAPSVEGQKNVIIEALSNAGIGPETISFVETHGTGTALGDPSEISALTKAYRSQTQKKGYCAIGSVKANIGHLDAAAGVAGLIKTVLALKNRQIPPNINFRQPNPSINFLDSPFYVNTELAEWGRSQFPRRAGISSFGVGGTNAHVIIEEAPLFPLPIPSLRKESLLLLSARTPSGLDKVQHNLYTYITDNPGTDISAAAYTLQIGRKAFNHRRMFVCDSRDNALAALASAAAVAAHSQYQEKRNPPVVFMFSGQGSQYLRMGQGLYSSEKVFLEHFDACSEILMPHLGLDLRDVLYPAASETSNPPHDINQTHLTQPALFAVEYSLAQLFLSWGVRPSALIGHSIGEYVAAAIAGVFSLEQILPLIAIRGRLMSQAPSGSMLSAPLSEEKAKTYVSDHIELSVVNAPSFCVFSGNTEAIQNLQQILADQGIGARRLATSHAFHSKMMEPILEEFAFHAQSLVMQKPTIPFISNLTGTWITDTDLASPDYWVRHLRNAVRFSDGITALASDADSVYLEIGPGNVLCTLTKAHFSPGRMPAVLPSIRPPQEEISDTAYILYTLGRLWLEGCDIDWNNYHKEDKRYRIPLPTYPFERKPHWINPTLPPQGFAAVRAGLIAAGDPRESIRTQQVAAKDYHEEPDSEKESQHPFRSDDDVEGGLAKIWQRVLGVETIGPSDNFFDLGGNSLNGVRVFTYIYEEFGLRLPLATLFSAPTIKLLAQVINEERYDKTWASLVAIQPYGSNPPFFCIHSEGGNVIEYHPLSQHLGSNQPFYGLQAQGLSGEKTVETSIEEMARNYLQDIKKKQPAGPYYIGGFCLGGVIAFEIAKQLENKGERVALLCIISSSTPAHVLSIKPGISRVQKIYHSLRERIALELSNLSVLTMKGRLHYLRDRITRLYLHFRFNYEQLAEILYRKFKLGTYEHSRPYMLEQLGKMQNRAFREFDPAPPIQTPIILIKPTRQPYTRKNDVSLGWKELSKDGVIIQEINCFHKNILKEPHVIQLSEIIKEYMEKK